MTAYSFKRRFVDPIRAKTKTHTIRLPRRGANLRRPGGHALPGEELQLYCGIRTAQCFLIGRATCSSSIRITIHLTYSWVDLYETPGRAPRRLNCLDGSHVELDPFARSDGFENWKDMWNFWAAVHSSDHFFDGFLIEWGQSLAPQSEDGNDAAIASRRLKEIAKHPKRLISGGDLKRRLKSLCDSE